MWKGIRGIKSTIEIRTSFSASSYHWDTFKKIIKFQETMISILVLFFIIQFRSFLKASLSVIFQKCRSNGGTCQPEHSGLTINIQLVVRSVEVN